MRRTLHLALLLLLALQGRTQIKALVGGTLVDGYGGRPLLNSVVIVDGERIRAVGRVGETPIPKGAELISTEGMTVLPGLWDMHVHLMINGHADYAHWDRKYPPLFEKVIMPASARQLLLAGVTSARDLGGPLKESISVRDAINRGDLPGPTMYVSGPFLQHRPYPGTEAFRWGVDGVEDAREKVRTLANAGVDCIKLVDQDEMTREEVFAIVEEAHKHKMKVVGHSHRPDEIRIGLQAGGDNLEHTGLSSAPAYPDDIIRAITERTAQMNKGPLFWTPTIEGLYNHGDLIDNPEKVDDPSWHLGLPDSVIADIRNSISQPGHLSYYQLTPLRKPTLETKFRQLQKTGVVMLIGTDSGIPMKFHSQSTWNELDVWVRAFGVDPLQAIKSATYWPSVFMGVSDRVGTVTPGKQADIIAVRGDALKHINLLQRVDIVIKKGKRSLALRLEK